MNKKQLTARVSQKLDGIPLNEAAKIIDAVFEAIGEGLREDKSVTLGEWGTYSFEKDDIKSQLTDKFTFPVSVHVGKSSNENSELTYTPLPKPFFVSKNKTGRKYGKVGGIRGFGRGIGK